MKFRFPFQKLLEHKKLIEELKARDYAEAKYDLDQENKILNDYFSSIDRTRVSVANLVDKGGTTGEELQQLEDFIIGQKVRIERQRDVIRKKMMIVEEKQELLRQAAIERKTFETLKQKQFEKFKKEVKKYEQKQIDEMVVMRFNNEEAKSDI